MENEYLTDHSALAHIKNSKSLTSNHIYNGGYVWYDSFSIEEMALVVMTAICMSPL